MRYLTFSQPSLWQQDQVARSLSTDRKLKLNYKRMLKHNVLTFLSSAEMNCDKIRFWRWGCGDWCFQGFDGKFDFLQVLLPLPYSTCWSMSIPQQLQFSLQYQAPSSSFLIPFSHASYSLHFSFDLDTWSGAKAPESLLPVPSENLSGSVHF